MNVSELAIRRPVLTTMAIAAFVVFGVVAYRTIGVSLFPDVDFPIVTVTVTLEGADPETVETEVTDPLEEALTTLSGIKTVRSESGEGIVTLFVEFRLSRDIDVASQDVRDKVASIRGQLPPEIDPPIIEKFDPDSAPILTVVVAAPVGVRELTRVVEDRVKPRIESTSGVGGVRVVGGQEREVRIWLRLDDLWRYDLTAQDVVDTLERNNVEPPGGRLEARDQEIVVKTRGRLDSVDAFRRLILVSRLGTTVRLGQVATVEDGLEDRRSLSRLDGRRAVSLLVRRQSGTNLVRIAEQVKARLAELRAELPEGYRVTLVQDLSVFVRQSLAEAESELIRGGALALLVLLAFLGSLRGALVAAVTIPTTIVSTYAFMLGFGFTANMMSMLALSISVGMIIDDSIVVIENTSRHMDEGLSAFDAAIAGMREIGFAVVATSLAIAAVFVPVAFMDGLVGRFFFEFGLTVTFAVVMSTFIALSLSPMLCSKLLRPAQRRGAWGWLTGRFDALLGLVERGYRGLLRLCLRARWLVVVVAIAAFVGSLSLTAFIGQEFTPAEDESQFNVFVEAPLGSTLERTSRNVALIEQRLRTVPEVTHLFTSIGAGVDGRVTNAGVLVKLVDRTQRTRSQQAVMAEVRGLLADFTHLDLSVDQIPRVSGGGFRSAPLQINLRGGDLDQLSALSRQLIAGLEREQGIVDLGVSYRVGKPEVEIRVDRERAADLGVDVQDLGKAVRVLVGGQDATRYKEGGETFDVRLRLVGDERSRADAIEAVPVATTRGGVVELRQLASVRSDVGPVQIDRQDRRRQVTILGNLESTKPLAAAIADVDRIAGEVGLPDGVELVLTGPGDLMQESFASMQFTMLMAVILIYMILAAQFESFVHPLTIMFSLPLSVGGAFCGLVVTGYTLSIFTMIGMIMLMGLVTKNAILLVDYTNYLRRVQGMSPDEALLTACPVRLRPILMTSCSTIAGMLPIAAGLGAGSETRAPMGAAVVGGMISSTLLTLIVIPAVYSLADGITSWIGRRLGA